MCALGSASPWWDSVWLSTLLVALGDLLVVAAAAVAVWIYGQQRQAADHQMQRASLDHLRGVKAALDEWYDSFFTTSYEGKAADERAEVDAKLVNKGQYMQNYVVPTAPVASLTELSGDTVPFSEKTVLAANVALSRMTVFNQLVRQQTDFNARFGVELYRLSAEDRAPIAEAAKRISHDIHSAIGDKSWYDQLKIALDDNIAMLDSASRPQLNTLRSLWETLAPRQAGGA